MEVSSLYKRMSPLCFLQNGSLVCYKSGDLYVFKNKQLIKKHNLFNTYKERYISKSKLLYRALRLGVRSAIALTDSRIIISIGNMLYEYDLLNNCLSDGFSLKERIRPLIFTQVKGINGFEDMVIFGGYLGNPDKKPVHIYKRVDKDKWDAVYTFKQGEINHIHNIIPDSYRNCLWVLTGDFDSSSAIWKITDNFKNIEMVFYNDQKYRSCIAFALPEGLLYATDTPFDENFVYLMDNDLAVKPICPLPGSCIYGCQWNDDFVFSSTVEADGGNQTLLQLLFSKRRGKGIKDQYVHLYMGNLKKGFKEIYKEGKDYLPFSFQFGVFKFPAGLNLTTRLYFQPVATSENDLDLMIMDNRSSGN